MISAGAPYSWFVHSKSDFTSVTKQRNLNSYLERIPTENHIPFPALLLFPLNNTSVSLNNEIDPSWRGTDLTMISNPMTFTLSSRRISILKTRHKHIQVSINWILIQLIFAN